MASKIAQYKIEPQNVYNMDEKGFAIGQLSNHYRIFSRAVFERRLLKGSDIDSSHSWITVLATIAIDGDVLPPSFIYNTRSNSVQESWLQYVDPTIHKCNFTTSPLGWTNDEIGLAWLTKVFEKHTKSKAANSLRWRLLIMDSHGSHLIMEFLNYYHNH